MDIPFSAIGGAVGTGITTVIVQQILGRQTKVVVDGCDYLYWKSLSQFNANGKQIRESDLPRKFNPADISKILSATQLAKSFDVRELLFDESYYFITYELLNWIDQNKYWDIADKDSMGESLPQLIEELSKHVALYAQWAADNDASSPENLDEQSIWARSDVLENFRSLSYGLLLMKLLTQTKLGVFEDIENELSLMAKYAPLELWNPKFRKALKSIGLDITVYWHSTLEYFSFRLQIVNCWDYFYIAYYTHKLGDLLIKWLRYEDATSLINTVEPISRKYINDYNLPNLICLLGILKLKISIAKDLQDYKNVINYADEYLSFPLNKIFVDRIDLDMRAHPNNFDLDSLNHFQDQVLVQKIEALIQLKKYNKAFKDLKLLLKTPDKLSVSQTEILRILLIASKLFKKIGYHEQYQKLEPMILKLKSIR